MVWKMHYKAKRNNFLPCYFLVPYSQCFLVILLWFLIILLRPALISAMLLLQVQWPMRSCFLCLSSTVQLLIGNFVVHFVYFSGSCGTSVCKEKVKWSRYRPGVAQRVGRGIALVFHDRGTRSGWVVSSMPRPHFTPGKDPIPISQEAGWDHYMYPGKKLFFFSQPYLICVAVKFVGGKIHAQTLGQIRI